LTLEDWTDRLSPKVKK